MIIFLTNLVLTIVVEIVANKFLFDKKDFKPSNKRVIFANIISNPLAQIAHRIFFINLWIVELVVIVFESLFYFRKRNEYYKVLIVSLVLNITSVLIGIILYSL
jgi:hypothetical protein